MWGMRRQGTLLLSSTETRAPLLWGEEMWSLLEWGKKGNFWFLLFNIKLSESCYTAERNRAYMEQHCLYSGRITWSSGNFLFDKLLWHPEHAGSIEFACNWFQNRSLEECFENEVLPRNIGRYEWLLLTFDSILMQNLILTLGLWALHNTPRELGVSCNQIIQLGFGCRGKSVSILRLISESLLSTHPGSQFLTCQPLFRQLLYQRVSRQK